MKTFEQFNSLGLFLKLNVNHVSKSLFSPKFHPLFLPFRTIFIFSGHLKEVSSPKGEKEGRSKGKSAGWKSCPLWGKTS